MRQFTPTQLAEYLENHQPAPFLLDVRESWEYEICALPNSILIPMGGIVERLKELPEDKEIVVICHHGVRSMQVALYLGSNGLDVINLIGGVDAWARDVDKTMATY